MRSLIAQPCCAPSASVLRTSNSSVPCGRSILPSDIRFPFRFDRRVRRLLSKCKGRGNADAVHADCTSRRFAMQTSMLLARLDHETRHRHAVADADRLALVTSTVTSEEYRRFLERVYGFEAAVETAIQMTPGLGEFVDLRSRVQLRLLKSDLAVLGVTNLARLPRCKSVAPFHAHHDALGWMY